MNKALEIAGELQQYGTAKEHGARFMFPNGWGASLISWEMSYGGSKGLWELAVLDKKGNLTYETDITSDVEGYLSPEDAKALLVKVMSLDEQGHLSKSE